MIELESPKEKPGHFIRLSLSLSILKKLPIRIVNIRAESDQKGLKKSDVMYIKMLSQISSAKIRDVEIGSDSFSFEPGIISEKASIINMIYPTIITNILPHIMLIYYNKNIKIRFNGPTHKEDKITIDYIKDVIIPMIEKVNIKQKIDINKRGYLNESGSVILTSKETKEVKPISILKAGELERVIAVAHSYGHKEIVNKFMLDGAINRLKQENIKIDSVESTFIENRESHKGYGLDLFAIYENSVIGANYTSIKKQAAQVGKEAADRLVSVINKKLPLDKHSSNLLIPFLALSKSPSEIIAPKKDENIDGAIYLCDKLGIATVECENKENYVHIKINPK